MPGGTVAGELHYEHINNNGVINMSKFEDLIKCLTSNVGSVKNEQKTDSLHRVSLQPLPQKQQEPVTDRFKIAEQATIECPAVAKVARYPLSLSEKRIYASLIGACVNHMDAHNTRPFSLLIAKQDASCIAAHVARVEGVYAHTLSFAGRSVQITTNIPAWIKEIPGGVVPGLIYTVS